MNLLICLSTSYCTFRIREVPNEVYKSLDAIGEGENWWEVHYVIILFLIDKLFLVQDKGAVPKLASQIYAFTIYAGGGATKANFGS